MPLLLAWLALLLGAVAAGAAIVGLLVAPPRLEPVALLCAAGGAAVSAWGLVVVFQALGGGGRSLLAALLGIGASIGGYGLAAALLPLLARAATPAVLEPPPAERRGPAFVLLSRTEPETYRPGWAATLAVEVSEPGALFVPVALLPFLFAATKARYRMTQGRSPARQTVTGLAQRLARILAVPEVHVAWCEPATHLAETVRGLAASGHRRIVVGTLGVASGHPEERAKKGVDELRAAEQGVDVQYTEPLWASEPIARLVAARARSFAEADPSAGVVLAMEAQPPAWEEAHADYDQQEASFAGRVGSLLTEEGLPGTNIRVGWMDWRSPDVTEAVRHLAALGCDRVAVVPAASPTETLATMLDLSRAAELARTEAAVQLLPPWGNEEVVAKELAAAMLRTLRDAQEND